MTLAQDWYIIICALVVCVAVGWIGIMIARG